MVTISVIKADIGGWVGHSGVHPDLLEAAREVMEKGRQQGVLLDYHVAYCGDDVNLIMTHTRGNEDPEVHGLAWEAFRKATEVAKALKHTVPVRICWSMPLVGMCGAWALAWPR